MNRFLVQATGILSVLMMAIFSTSVSGQTLSLNDKSVIQSTLNRIGINIGNIDSQGNGQILKNLIGSGNPGFEPMQNQQIWTLTSTGTTNTFVVPDKNDAVPSNYWEGGTFSVVESQSRGAELGCTGTIESNTGTNTLASSLSTKVAPVITVSSDCSAPFSAGDTVIMRKSTYPTPESWWENAGLGGTAGTVSGGAKLLTDTTDLCSDCGTQALNMNASAGGSTATATWYFDGDYRSNLYVLVDGVYQISFWAKSAAGNPVLSVSASRLSKGGFNCGTYTPKLTSSWAQYTLSCTASESAGGTTPGVANVSFATKSGSIYLDNVSFEKTSSDSSNTTVLRDEVIQALRNYFGSSTANNAGVFRYGIGQNGETIGNWTQPDYARSPTAAGTGYFVAPNGAGSMRLSLEDYLIICQLLNAEPYLEVPATFTTYDAANLIEFLAGSSSSTFGNRRASLGQEEPWTNTFSKIHLSFCDECWNGTVLPGQSLPYRAGAPNGEYYYDYSVRTRDIFAAMRGSSAYSASSFDLVMGAQTSVNASMDAAIRRARPDSIEIGSSLYGTVNSYGSDAALWQPAVVEPYEMATNPADPSNFYRSVHDYQSQKTCGASGAAVCNVHIYGGGQNTAAGNIDQQHLDYINSGAGQGVVTALQPLLNLQYYGIKPQSFLGLTGDKSSDPSGKTLNSLGGVVDMGGTTNNMRPGLLGLSLVNQSMIGPMYACPIANNPTYNFAGSANGNSPIPALKNVPYLFAFCFQNGNNRSLILINTDLSGSHTVSFAGTNLPQGTVTVRQLASNDLNDMNEAPTGATNSQTTASVAAETNTLSSPKSIALPSFSVTALDYTVASETATPTSGTSSTPLAVSSIAPVLPATASSLEEVTSSITKAATTSSPVINCSSGFASSGACGVGVQYMHPNFGINGNGGAAMSGTAIDLQPTGVVHNPNSVIYQTPVNDQAFTATFTFIPNGQNLAFVVENSNNNPDFNGPSFVAGAGCEAGFFQAFQPTPPNNIFALELDSDSALTLTGPFTYSSTQIYGPGQSPCLPNDNGPNYTPINKISTSPVSLDSAASAQGTTSGHTYSATITYDGSNVVLNLYDVTAGGSCPGASCFTNTWTNVNIPTQVGGNTAYVGFTAATGEASIAPLYVNSLVYTAGATTITSTPTAATPTFSLAAGTYASAQTVTLSDSTSGATIYYTTNGTTPTTSSTKYTGAIAVSSTETIEAIAVASGYSNSAVASAAYAINPTVATPTFSVAPGTYSTSQTVTISDATAGTTILYTTNGSTPTTSSSVYSGPIMVSSTETLKAIAVVGDPVTSAVATAAYTITTTTSGSYAYINNPNGGFYAAAFHLNGGAKVTSGHVVELTDGGTNEARSAWFNTPVPVQQFTTDFTFQQLNASGDGMTFTIQGQGSTAVGASGGGLGYQYIAHSVAVKFDLYNNSGEGNDSTGLYTNGASPTTPAVNLSSTPINLHSGDVMHAHLVYDGTNLTMTLTDTVTGGSVTEIFPVDIPSIVGGDTAYVGFTGGSGDATATQKLLSWTFTGPTGTQASVTPPTFSPGSGSYTASQAVTIRDTSPGATIYYTTDGSRPTTASKKYTNPLTLSGFVTLQAIAMRGKTLSQVAKASYRISPVKSNLSTPTFSRSAGTYTSAQSVAISDKIAGATLYYTTNGATPTSASTKYKSPITVSKTETLKAIAAKAGYTNSAVASEAYTIETILPRPYFSRSAGTYTSDQAVTIRDVTPGVTIYYTTNGATPTSSSTKYNSPITVSKTETLKAIAAKTGYANSAVASEAYTIATILPRPYFSRSAGTYTSDQVVTIRDVTPGVTIYYTTNGATPTTASAKYTSAISIRKTETLKAIAAKTSYTNSAVASEAYTIATILPIHAFSRSAGTYTAS